MNIEFLLLVADYFKTLSKRDRNLDWVLSLIISIVCFIIIFKTEGCIDQVRDILLKFSESVVSLCGVLIGFSIATITILVSTNSVNIEEIKNKKLNIYIGNQQISLFDLMIINFTYSVVIEGLLLLFNFIITISASKIQSITM
ncbi:MAG: hypothetical protein ACK43K_04255, partial [Chitinophagales bacterium]